MKITRRDFLRAATAYGVVMLGTLFQHRWQAFDQPKDSSAPNLIILLFDALSARNMSLYGYQRSTTPHMMRFAQRATVFHRHYAAGNFTSPGTASLLTGTYPWTHRAFQQAGVILRKLADHNLFRLVDGSYECAGYAQNLWADLFLYQFGRALDVHVKSTTYSLDEHIHYNDAMSQKDALIAFRSFEDFLEQDYGIPGSLYFSFLDKFKSYLAHEFAFKELRADYPRGIPNLEKYKYYFLLEDVFKGVAEEIRQLHLPFLGYYHFFAPHGPYCPHRRFIGIFDDDWNPVTKKPHKLSPNKSAETLQRSRREYDEYLANTDAEFGRLYDYLQDTGILDRSYLIITSDHGELFERGTEGHVTQLLYEPVIHVPLIIAAPGQSERKDVYSPTSCVDLLPTLLEIMGGSFPDWLEGNVLPGFGGEATGERAIYAIEAKKNPARSPITQGTFAMIKSGYKLIWYLGYPGYEDVYELYHLETDPEELLDLSQSHSAILDSMKKELQIKLDAADRPFRRTS